MNELTKNWLAMAWNRQPQVLRRKQGLLVLYAFKGQFVPEMKTTTNFHKQRPCSVTCGEQAIHRPPKAVVCEWLIRSNNPLTQTGRNKKPSVTRCWQWIMAWQHVTRSDCEGVSDMCISSALDGPDDMFMK
jgi:hypothetical protein